MKGHKETGAKVTFDAFDYLVRVTFTDDVVAARVKIDSIVGKYPGGPAGAIHSWADDNPVSYLFLPYDARPSTIAHECWHVVRQMLRICGAELENEVVAYHLGWLVGKVHDIQKRLRK